MKTHKVGSLIFLLIFITSLLAACSEDSTPTPAEPQATVEQAPAALVQTFTPTAEVQPEGTLSAPSRAASPLDAPKNTWTVLLYQDGDDEVLEKDVFIDLNEAEMVGSTAQVHILSQIDRKKGGYKGGDNWAGTKRFLVEKDTSGDLENLISKELEDLGEVDMSKKETLVNFAVWAIQAYPAQRYALIMSDHGMGWPGGWTDSDSKSDTEMAMNEIDAALAEITEKTGIGQFDLVGFDACLMAQLESFSAIAPYARYTVASEETEPSLGWAYASFLKSLVDRPAMDGKELAKSIVDSYITGDGRITDDRARQALVEESFNRSGKMSAAQVSKEFSFDITLTAVENAALVEVNSALNELAIALQNMKSADIARLRSHTQAYTSIFDRGIPKPYIDLGHFATLLMRESNTREVRSAAGKVQRAVQAAVLTEKHGSSRPGSSGITIYFPTSKLYKDTASKDWMPYTTIAGRFAAASLWDDFLAFQYAKKKINPSSADLSVLAPSSPKDDFTAAAEQSAPEDMSAIQAPGKGEVMFNALESSKDVIKANGSVTLSADIQGNNIAYIYIYSAYFDPASNSYLTMDLDFVDAGETKEVDGVSYPDWGDSQDQSFEIDWQPTVTLISDGKNDVFAASQAETYGMDAETTTYQVWGTYWPKGSEDGYSSFLRFDANGELKGVFVLTDDEDNSAAPREVTLTPGDQFIPEEEWLTFENDPEGEYEYYDGDTLTFGKDGFVMTYDTGYTGSYQVGLIVEDLEGNTYENYIEVKVK